MSANQVTRTVTDYTVDPNQPGTSILRDVLARVQGFLVPATVGGDTDPGLQFFGYGPAVQDFRGVAATVATGSVMRDGASDLSDAATATPMGDPVRKIFADRLRRQLS